MSAVQFFSCNRNLLVKRGSTRHAMAER